MQGIVSPMKVVLIHLFFSKFFLYRALRFFTKKEINRRDYFLISILISSFFRWVYWSWGFFPKFWKKSNYFAAIKNLKWAIQLVLSSTSSSPVTVSLCCSSSAAVYWLLCTEGGFDLSSGRFGAPGWLLLMDACPWNSRYSETVRGGYKCCLSGFRQWLRCLSRGECAGIALPGSGGTNTQPCCWATGLSPGCVTPTQTAIAVIKSSRRCH